MINIVFSIAMMEYLFTKDLTPGRHGYKHLRGCAVQQYSRGHGVDGLLRFRVCRRDPSFLFMFALGALFGGLMDRSSAADKFARCIVSTWKMVPLRLYDCEFAAGLGRRKLFIICFTVLPIYLSIFRGLNIPRKLLPVSIWAGSAGLCPARCRGAVHHQYDSGADPGHGPVRRFGYLYCHQPSVRCVHLLFILSIC